MHCYKMDATVIEKCERESERVRASVSHPLVGVRMCEVLNVATPTWNHEMLQQQEYKKNSGVWLRRLNMVAANRARW